MGAFSVSWIVGALYPPSSSPVHVRKACRHTLIQEHRNVNTPPGPGVPPSLPIAFPGSDAACCICLEGRKSVPDFPIVDSHVHLCDPNRFGYDWTKNAPSLKRLVLPADLTKAAGKVEIDRFVFVEVDVDFPQHLDEAEWVQGLALADKRLGGMVAALPLERGKAIEAE